ncbi:MAG: hypothetical protein LKJ78_00195 [Serratia liquefaciens]|jgi:hypothetical protein|nr:hypothetical protein [Serratia liquefaciens]MCH4263837.1 hypothetical protein [Serratia liquefaciens]MCI1215597.1 hypothetical protein [Serratia liquefaciens]MCI1233926.1 hypothetical protein [Serratia liquefaciens]MCI1249508.1 hypothetical protein [Serratia liquefaciens]
MLSFEERMALLDKALSRHTAESLYEKLTSYAAVGPTVVGYELKSEVKAVFLEPRNLTCSYVRTFGSDLDFWADSSQLDQAA